MHEIPRKENPGTSWHEARLAGNAGHEPLPQRSSYADGKLCTSCTGAQIMGKEWMEGTEWHWCSFMFDIVNVTRFYKTQIQLIWYNLIKFGPIWVCCYGVFIYLHYLTFVLHLSIWAEGPIDSPWESSALQPFATQVPAVAAPAAPAIADSAVGAPERCCWDMLGYVEVV